MTLYGEVFDKRGKQALSRLVVVLLLATLYMGGCTSTPDQAGDREFESALALMKDKKYQQAITAFEGIIARNDKLSGAYVNLGIAYKELGKRKEAIQALNAAIKRNSNNAIAYNQLGIIYRQEGEFSKARKAYEKSISSRGSYSKAYLNLGILCDIYLRDLRCAIRNYEKYQSLTKEQDKQVGLWIADLKKRRK